MNTPVPLFSTHNTDKTARQKATLSLLPFLFLFFIPLLSPLPHTSLFVCLLLLLLLSGGLFLHGTPARRPPLALWLLLALLSSGALSSLLLFRDFSALLPLLCLLAALIPFVFPDSADGFLRTYGLLGGLLGLFALLSFLLGKGAVGYVDASHSYAEIGRSAVFFGNPNVLAAFLLPAPLGLLTTLLSQKGRGLRLLYGLAFAFALLGLLSTLCRGALLALLLALLLFLSFYTKSPFPLLLALCLLPGVLSLLPYALRERLLSVLSGDSSVSYRLSLWRSLFSLPKSALLFGVGEGKEALSRLVLPHLYAGLERVEHLHSIFWRFLVSEGVFGLTSFLFAIALALFSPLPQAPSPRLLSLAARSALFSLCFFGLFDDLFYTTQTGVIFFWLLGVNYCLQYRSFSS